MTTTASSLDQFLEISVSLTGFDELELQATGLLQTYYDTVVRNSNRETLAFFFTEVRSILHTTQGNESRRNALIRSNLMPASSYDGLARNIIGLWYTGQWNSATDGEQVNAASYIEALMWPAANTHPPGAKQPGYGSWAEPPIGAAGNPVKPTRSLT